MADTSGKRIAVIPARGGSKRIPKKNIKEFMGKPMISWSIDAAKASQLFDEIIVSTDDKDIAAIARQSGATTPFVRPAALSDDHTATTAVIAHAIQWAVEQQWQLQAVCCIYATAPFIETDDIKQAWDLLNSGNWCYAFTVTDFAAPIFRSFTIDNNGGLAMFFPEHFTTRSQDLPEAYHDAGQFYWGRPEAWLQNKAIFDKHSIPVVIPRYRVQDIDTEADWQRAIKLKQLLDKQ
ncbi:MAG: pseudaminic acid cytidylyltransferase [Pseudomonadota bacterium]